MEPGIVYIVYFWWFLGEVATLQTGRPSRDVSHKLMREDTHQHPYHHRADPAIPLGFGVSRENRWAALNAPQLMSKGRDLN